MTPLKAFSQDFGRLSEIKQARKDIQGKPEVDRFVVLLTDLFRLRKGLPFLEL